MSEMIDFIKDVEDKIEKFLNAKKELEVAKSNLDKVVEEGRGLSSKISGMLSDHHSESTVEDNTLSSKKETSKNTENSKTKKESSQENKESEKSKVKDLPKANSSKSKEASVKTEDEKIIETEVVNSVNTEESSVKDTKEEKSSSKVDDSIQEFEDIFADDEFSGLDLDFTLDANLSDSDVDNIEL